MKQKASTKTLSWLLSLALMLSLVPALNTIALADDEVQSPAYSGGTGTEADPYLISTVDDWKALANAVNGGEAYNGKYFRQTANLDMSEAGNLEPVGTMTAPFAGNYEGDGFAISKATISGVTTGESTVAGVFGVLTGKGSISNLIVENATVTATQGSGGWDMAFAGGLVAVVEDAALTDCSVSGSNVTAGKGGDTFSGAVVGYAQSNNGEVTTISQIASTNNTVVGGGYGGGVLGSFLNEGTLSMTNCYAVGSNVNAQTYSNARMGAFLGASQGGNISLTNCFVYGCSVNATSSSGGNAGLFDTDTLHGNVSATNTYYYDTNNLPANAESATAKTADEMKSLASTLGDEFTQGSNYPILLHPVNLEVSIEGWTAGETAKTPSVTRNSSDGEVTYQYKVKDADGNTYSETVPTTAGEYTVKAAVAATDTHKAAEATADFTIAPAPTYDDDDDDDTPAITVPVSSDSASVSVTATVSGAAASVKALTETELNKIVNSDTHTGEVEIDVSSLGKDIKTATIPTETVKVVEKAANDATNDATGLTVKLTDGSITLDAQALTAVTEQAKGNTIQLNLDGISTSSMTSAQRETVQTMDVQAVYDAYMTSNGSRISDFHGGKATVAIPYTLKEGQSRNGVLVWYIADNGDKTEMPTSYDGKEVSFTTTHFSNYVVVYDAERAAICPQDATCPISKFVDADASAWYHDGVHWALDKGVMNGVSPKYFNPNGDTSRAMVVTMLWRLEGSPVVSGEMKFVDVAEGTWYTEAVRWAASVGIISGSKIPAETTPWPMGFRPNDAVTREQLAAMLYRYAQYKKADVSASASLSSYGDAASVSSWATSAMQWAVGSGIVNGMDGNLVPAGNATRAQVATMLMRYSTNK